MVAPLPRSFVEQPVANLPAQHRVADDDGHDMARIIAVRDLCRIEPAAQLRGALVQLAAFDGAVFQMADAGQGGRRHGRRQRRREDEAGSKLRTKSHSAAEPAI